MRKRAEIDIPGWEYKDAWLRADIAAARIAWQKYLSVRRSKAIDDFRVMAGVYGVISTAAQFDDIDPAAAELLEIYPLIDTRNVEDNNANRTHSRQFVALCIMVLEREASIGHPSEAALDAAMYDVHIHAETVMMEARKQGLRSVRELRARRASSGLIAQTRSSATSIQDDLTSLVAWPDAHDRG